METLLKLPIPLKAKRIDGILSIQIKKRKYCACNGKLHVHTTFNKIIKIAYLLPQGTILAKVTYYYYQCQTCNRFIIDDGNLGIQHSSSSNYRQAICALLPSSRSVAAIATLTNLPISTIRGWQKQF